MVYDPTTQAGVPSRPAASGYVQYPYGQGESPRAPRHGWSGADPEGLVVGNPGDSHTNITSGTVFRKNSGTGTNTGWSALTAVTAFDGWFQDNIPGSQSGVAQGRFSGADGGIWVAPAAGSIVGLWCRSSQAQSIGSLTITLEKNGSGGACVGGSGSTLQCLFGDADQFKVATDIFDGNTGAARCGFVAGAYYKILATTAAWSPTTADIRSGILVQFS